MNNKPQYNTKPMLQIDNIWKSYNSQSLLNGINFNVMPNETVCLLGPSGSGKSTLLRIIAGLDEQEKGRIFWGDQDITNLPAHLRCFGLMFQDYALFPHRTVAQNIAFGLRMQELPKNEIEIRVRQALEQVDLLPMIHRRVTDLSGGEQQRVALARALAPRPRLLMLDEPLGALDYNLRSQLLGDLRQLLLSTKIPAIYVTHDQEEAFTIANRLILLHNGRIEQEGSPMDVYNHPVSDWAARFLGMKNLLPGQIISLQPLRVHTEIGILDADSTDSYIPKLFTSVTVLLRPTGVHLCQGEILTNKLNGIVEDVIFHNERFHIRLRCTPALTLQFSFDLPLPIGEQLCLFIVPSAVICLKLDG